MNKRESAASTSFLFDYGNGSPWLKPEVVGQLCQHLPEVVNEIIRGTAKGSSLETIVRATNTPAELIVCLQIILAKLPVDWKVERASDRFAPDGDDGFLEIVESELAALDGASNSLDSLIEPIVLARPVPRVPGKPIR